MCNHHSLCVCRIIKCRSGRGDHGVSIDGEFDEEPQLLCESQHDGDVMDLQVSVNNFITFHSERIV